MPSQQAHVNPSSWAGWICCQKLKPTSYLLGQVVLISGTFKMSHVNLSPVEPNTGAFPKGQKWVCATSSLQTLCGAILVLYYVLYYT